MSVVFDPPRVQILPAVDFSNNILWSGLEWPSWALQEIAEDMTAAAGGRRAVRRTARRRLGPISPLATATRPKKPRKRKRSRDGGGHDPDPPNYRGPRDPDSPYSGGGKKKKKKKKKSRPGYGPPPGQRKR